MLLFYFGALISFLIVFISFVIPYLIFIESNLCCKYFSTAISQSSRAYCIYFVIHYSRVSQSVSQICIIIINFAIISFCVLNSENTFSNAAIIIYIFL